MSPATKRFPRHYRGMVVAMLPAMAGAMLLRPAEYLHHRDQVQTMSAGQVTA